MNVDEETLLGALRFFYRFAGHGTVAYGDHRGEGGLGSNGKDGMIAAAMQIATGARGDVTSYEKARQYLALSMIDSYPLLVMGHGDEGRGDGIWRGIITSYLMKDKPALYRESMDRLTWWHDLSREPGGSIGIATLAWRNGVVGASGPGMGLSYTAPLRTLRITGAALEALAGLHPARKPVGHRGGQGFPLDRPQPEILRLRPGGTRPCSLLCLGWRLSQAGAGPQQPAA